MGIKRKGQNGIFYHLSDILGLSKTYNRERSLTRISIYGAALFILGLLFLVETIR